MENPSSSPKSEWLKKIQEINDQGQSRTQVEEEEINNLKASLILKLDIKYLSHGRRSRGKIADATQEVDDRGRWRKRGAAIGGAGENGVGGKEISKLTVKVTTYTRSGGL